MNDLELLSDIPDWEWPPEAAGVLLEALQQRDVEESELMLAAELASSIVVMNDEIAGALLDLLQDEAAPVSARETAAIALGPTLEDMSTYDPGDPIDALEEPLVSQSVYDSIRQTLHDTYLKSDVPKRLRRRTLEAAVRSPESWQVGAVRAAYYSGDDEWKLTAVFCMRYVPDFEREIVEALESQHPSIRLQAVRAAGAYDIEAAWPHIRAILEAAKNVEKPLLLAAISAGSSIRWSEASSLLARLDTSDPEISAAIAEADALDNFESDEV